MKFAKPEKQAEEAAKKVNAIGQSRDETRHDPKKITGLCTYNHFKNAIKKLISYLREQKTGEDIHTVGKERVEEWLNKRSEKVGQDQLNQDREAINKWLAYKNKEQIETIKSNLKENTKFSDKSRYYTPQQIEKIKECQTYKNAISTQIAYEAGLRAHELFSISRPDEQPNDERQWHPDMHDSKEGEQVKYTVIGKGGLIREITLSKSTSQKLEELRKDSSTLVKDRNIHYLQKYNISGGNAWSASFGRASQRILGWSNGAHGLRHSYAQERVISLQANGYTFDTAKEIVSNELGHFRIEQTEEYLR